LIHFIMARKLRKKAQIPDSYRAKEPREYFAILQGSESGPVSNCYLELCTLTHPAAASVSWMLSIDAEGESVVSKHNPDPDAIADLCSRHRDLGPYVISPPLFWSMAVFKLLNGLGISSLDNPVADLCRLDDTEEWLRITRLMEQANAQSGSTKNS